MATHLLIARKGGGKSAVSMEVLQEKLLLKGETRPIITNLDVRDHKFASLIHDRGGSTAGRLYVRRNRLSKTNVDWQRAFWRDRGDDEMIVRQQRSADGYLSYEPSADVRHGCIYIVDEMANAFGNREWQKFSAECGWYLRAERHLSDDLYLLCQNEELLDVTFCKLFNEVWRINANWLTTVAGFRGTRKFIVRVHTNIDDQHPMTRLRTIEYQWDQKLMDCYRTNSLGGQKVQADKGAVQRGFSMRWLYAAVVLLALCPLLLLKAIPKASRYLIGKTGLFPTLVHQVPTVAAVVAPAVIRTNTFTGTIEKPIPARFERVPDRISPQSLQRLVTPPRKPEPVLLSYLMGEVGIICVTTEGVFMLEDGWIEWNAVRLPQGRWRIGKEPEGFKIKTPWGAAS